MEKNEQSMVKLDSIFKALGVENENDVRLLAQYFINHRQYKDLIKNKSYTQQLSAKTDTGSGGSNGDDEKSSQLNSNRNKSEGNYQDSQNDQSENDPKLVPLDQIQLIHPNEVLTALKTFVSLHHKGDA